ncbi:hypothetical protein [Shewanella phage FishSpeaker]|nr:hypothetical protein [Shewanella phage FishSpeaker]
MGKPFEPTVSLFDSIESKIIIPDELLESINGLEALGDISGNKIFKVCDKHAAFIEFDKEWATALRKYVFNFTTRREGGVDYMDFFGSPYLGLQKIVFKTGDRNEWFSTVFDIDELELKKDITDLKIIGKDWHVLNDMFNLTIPYILHRVFHSKLDEKTKHQAMKDMLSMYQYKCLTSILNNDYPWTASKEVAVETYNQLSMKFDLKKYGSWRALIEARSENILDKHTGIHYNTIVTMSPDKKVLYMVGDIQDRLRGMINDLNTVFHSVKNKTNLISFEGNKVTLEDGEALRFNQKEELKYKNYIEQVLVAERGFYKEELIDYAVKDMGYAPRDKLTYIIENFPALYNSKKGDAYVKLVDDIIVHMFEYLHEKQVNRINLYEVLVRMRGIYNSRRGNTDELISLRDRGDELVKTLTGIKTPITVTGLRTSFLLYIVLRTLTREHYSE